MLDRTASHPPVSRDADLSARQASLVHVSDEEPGIRRKKSGRGFCYIDLDGAKLGEGETVARIRALAIPPAWSDVWISPHPDGHIQATGRDAKGRKQYRYHERWALCRDDVKYGNLAAFAESLPTLRAAVDHDLRRRGLPRERVVASVIWLLDHTMIRVGNPAYARENGSFGLTTLRDRHVEINGSSLRFAFKGKSGKEWKLKLVDRRIARALKAIQDLPGQHLFQYVGEGGVRHAVRSDDVNDYMREAAGEDFSSKHFRTWGGTVHAATLLTETPVPETKTGQKRMLNRIIDAVAARLGNTRTVCRNCYVHPRLIDSWTKGTLVEEMVAAQHSSGKLPDGLDAEEFLVLTWLRNG